MTEGYIYCLSNEQYNVLNYLFRDIRGSVNSYTTKLIFYKTSNNEWKLLLDYE
jgi:hypothetical protein